MTLVHPHGDPGGAREPRVAIVDDHELLAHSLALALSGQGVDATVVPTTDEEAIVGRVAEARPDVVLLDLDLGSIGSALPLIGSLAQTGCQVVMMTGETSRATWGECVEAGAAGVIAKTVPFDQLLDRVASVAASRAAMSTHEREDLLSALREHRARERVRLEPFQRLTVREGEVLHELMQGRSAEEIAQTSYVSLTTVRTHIRAILHKLGVSSQLSAVARATRAGWAHEAR